jgi:hypothetical protein
MIVDATAYRRYSEQSIYEKRYIRAEIAKWAKVIKASGAKIE